MRRLLGGARAIGPIHAIQARALGPLDPVGNRGEPDAELAGHRTPGLATANGGYHGTTTCGLTFCLLIEFPRKDSVSGAW